MNEFGRNSTSVEPSAPTGEESTTHVASSPLDRNDSTLIVGLDGREHDADALALAESLEASLGGELLLAHVVPPAPPGKGMIECERLERQQGRELLTQASANLGDGADTQLVEPSPAARGLTWLAAKRGASILVLGSSHRGTVGRIVPGGSHPISRVRALRDRGRTGGLRQPAARFDLPDRHCLRRHGRV